MIMDEAFKNVVGRPVTMPGEAEENPSLLNQHKSDFDLWNAAWSMAKTNHFFIEI